MPVVHDVNVDAVEEFASRARTDASAARMPLEPRAEWRPEGGAQPRATIPRPGGEGEFAADFTVGTDSDEATLERLRAEADERCPGAYCIRNPIAPETRVARA